MMRGINHQNRRTSERRAKLAWAIPSEKEEDEVNIFEDEEDNYQFKSDEAKCWTLLIPAIATINSRNCYN